MSLEELKALEQAANDMDWEQVAGIFIYGPPCFHLEQDGRFCGRSKSWAGHGYLHRYVSLADLIKIMHQQRKFKVLGMTIKELKATIIGLKCKPSITKITELDTRWQELISEWDKSRAEVKKLENMIIKYRAQFQAFADLNLNEWEPEMRTLENVLAWIKSRANHVLEGGE